MICKDTEYSRIMGWLWLKIKTLIKTSTMIQLVNMLKMLVSISTLGRSRSQSRGLFIYVIAIISSFRRIFCSVHSSIFIYRLQCWFNCYSRDCPTGFSLFYFAALSLKCLNYNYVWNSVCFGFGKYEITAQIETFV